MACDDFAAAHFVGTELHAAVASRPGAGAFRVGRAEEALGAEEAGGAKEAGGAEEAGGAFEEALEVRRLPPAV